MPEKAGAGVGFLEDKGSGSAARDPLIVSYLHPCLPSTPSFSAQDALFSCTAHQLGLKDIAEAMGGKFSFVGAIFSGIGCGCGWAPSVLVGRRCHGRGGESYGLWGPLWSST